MGVVDAPDSNYNNMPFSATLYLKQGDVIDLFLGDGSIYDSINRNTHFTGFLLQEDLGL